MTQTSPPPELTQAYQFIKTGQRPQAGQILREYLAAHPRDPNAWWLMAHVVRKDEHVRQCLETVLKLNPQHNGARQKLARLSVSPDDAPNGVFSTGRGPSTPPPAARSSPAQTDPAPAPAPASFEEYLAQTGDRLDPFAAPPVDDPFESIPASASPVWPPFDPRAQSQTIGRETAQAQAPGAGNQPEWGPGLAFLRDETATGQPPQPPRPRRTASPGLIIGADIAAEPPRPQIDKGDRSPSSIPKAGTTSAKPTPWATRSVASPTARFTTRWTGMPTKT